MFTFNLNTILILLLGIVIVSILVILIRDRLASRKEARAYQAKISRAHVILAAGGPHTIAEFLEIMPNACPKCGGRRFRDESIYTLIPPDPNYPPSGIGVDDQKDYPPQQPQYEQESKYICTRCGYTTILWHPEYTNSPYLSTEDNVRLGDWSPAGERSVVNRI